ncbi:MAG: ABC transporter permease [Acidobacteria bacterium]|nr:MAG: ABC transporter permease [Acidobacteriota bacterium]
MAATLAIVRRDLVRWARNPGRLVLLLGMPLALAAIFALAFGTGGEAGLTVRVLVIDEDGTALSEFLSGALGSQEDTGPLDVEIVGEEGRAMIERGEASALVIIPEGFTDAFLDGRPATLRLIKNPAEQFLPQAVEEALRAAAVVLSQASRTFRDELAEFSAMLAADHSPDPVAIGAMSTRIAAKLQTVEPYLFPPVIELETISADGGDESDDGPSMQAVLSLVLPGLAVLSLLFFAQAATRDVMEEREHGLLRRLLSAPVGTGEYLLAKCVSVVTVSALGFALLIGIGRLAGVAWGPPVAVIGLVLSASIAASGLLLLLVSLVSSEMAANALTTIVVMVSAMVGGSFVPLPALPDFLLPVARLTVNYWATSGFLVLIRDGGGPADVVPQIGVLAGGGLAMLAVGAFRLARRIRAGDV